MMIMMGAFYQLVPVLAGGQVPWIALSRAVHFFMTIGILALAGGLILISPLLIAVVITALFLAFTIFLTQLLTALFRVKANRPVVVAMRISLISLALAVSLGVLELGTVTGLWPPLIERSIVKSLHVTLALSGGIGGLIVGVGFHVIPMFYLSSPFPEKRAVWILHAGLFSLAAFSVLLLISAGSAMLFTAMLPGVAASIIFAVTVWQMLLKRKRKVVDATLRFWQIGLLAFPLSLLCLAAQLFWPDEQLHFAFGLLFLMGFATTITNGMLYKIVPFLIWFHRFSTLVGKVKVPLLKDILPAKRTKAQLLTAVLALLTLLPGALLHIDWLVRAGAVFWLTSSGWLALNLIFAFRQKPVIND